ncbi:MAG: transporter substrate-binding domain-containing protein [Candidatus Krumholzibacteria bacterium]|jgi:membrane-bound lytic murein transglycosylase F|nr:transporter substrate-binding domain-containing protein [Candidatus Krumholzibacteria bacterium]
MKNNRLQLIALIRHAATLWVALLVLTACERIEDFGRYGGPDRQIPAVAYPMVSHDLPEIRSSGTLRMLTRYNATSYFVHRGGEAGFDYELCQRFARGLGLALEVVIPEPGEDVISLLNSGAGDVVCAGLTATGELEQYVDATRPVNFVHKVVVLAPQDPRPTTIEALAGLTITVPSHDPVLGELVRWRDRHKIDVAIQPSLPLVEAEELIARVSRGELAATVADDVLIEAVRAYLEGDIRLGPVLGERRAVVWLVRRNSPELRAELNAYLRDNLQLLPGGGEQRSQTYGIIYDRYFRNPRTIRSFQQDVDRPDKSGRISRFDELIRQQTAVHDLDWRLVAALIYQESRFYPLAVSKAGAQGLMQVIPRFAGAQADSLFVPEANLRAGLRLMARTWNGFAYMDSLERVRFTLAAYHAGIGHLNDARRLAMDVDWDPNRWEGALAETLPWLAHRRWYDQTRHGYYRGNETVRYVEEILNRYRMYMRLVPLDPAAAAVADEVEAAAADSAAYAASVGAGRSDYE